MASHATGRVIFLYLVCVQLVCAQYEIPDVSIQALKPKGIRVSIPGILITYSKVILDFYRSVVRLIFNYVCVHYHKLVGTYRSS